MNCPVDGTLLVMSERSGIEIDYCPDCRGVWLDHGELDKIIERSDDNPHQAAADRDDDDISGGEAPNGKRRRGGFLANLLELGE